MVMRWVQGALTALAAVVLCAATPGVSHAIQFDLTNDFCTGGCGTMPAGTVTVTDNGAGGVDITVHLLQGNSFVKTGAGSGNAFLFNASGVVLTDITVDPHVPVLTAVSGSFGNGASGPFAFGITCASCNNGAGGAFSTDIVFHIANATIADVTALNSAGQNFAADILSGQNGNTGLVG